MPDPELRDALRFIRAFALRQADQIVEIPGGFGVLDPQYPFSYHHNRLIFIEKPAPDRILEITDQILGGAGLGHRMLVVEDDQHGAACVPALTAAGYQHSTSVILRYRPDPPLPALGRGGVRVSQVTEADLRVPTRQEWLGRLPNADEAMVTQLVERRRTLVRGADRVEFLAVRDAEQQIRSRADLYLHPTGEGGNRALGTIAQIEDLVTSTGYTGRGYAGAILAEAISRARLAGAGLIFLVADADDWPQSWYRRIGFTPIGTFHEFVRPQG